MRPRTYRYRTVRKRVYKKADQHRKTAQRAYKKTWKSKSYAATWETVRAKERKQSKKYERLSSAQQEKVDGTLDSLYKWLMGDKKPAPKPVEEPKEPTPVVKPEEPEPVAPAPKPSPETIPEPTPTTPTNSPSTTDPLDPVPLPNLIEPVITPKPLDENLVKSVNPNFGKRNLRGKRGRKGKRTTSNRSTKSKKSYKKVSRKYTQAKTQMARAHKDLMRTMNKYAGKYESEYQCQNV